MDAKLIVSFATSIYNPDAIGIAIHDYAAICYIEVEYGQSSTVCSFSEGTVDLELAAREFSNYIIELLVSGASE